MLVYSGGDLKILGYTDLYFQGDIDFKKSVFTLNKAAVVWRSIKQSSIADSTMEAEYIAASKVAKEAVWLKNFLSDLEVVPNMDEPITLYCDNSGTVENSKEPRSHKRGKHIERKYHLIREIVNIRDMTMAKIPTLDNLADLFTKTLSKKQFFKYVEEMGLKETLHFL